MQHKEPNEPRAWKEFAGSTTAAVVVVPTILLIVQMLVVERSNVYVGAIVLAVVGLGSAAWFYFTWRKREKQRRRISQLADGEFSPSHKVGALVTFVNPDQVLPEDQGWHRSTLGFLLERLKPSRLYLFVTPKVLIGASLRDSLEKSTATITIVDVENEITPQEVEEKATALLRRDLGEHGGVICVDITSGKSTFSVGLYNAAYNSSVYVTYIEGGRPDPKADNRQLRAIVEPVEEESSLEEAP